MTYTPTQWKPTTYDNDTFKLDGQSWYANSEYAYSFSSPDNNALRFEVRDGDHLNMNRFTDVAGSERSEMSQAVRNTISSVGGHFSIEYKFMIEPGAKNTAQWLVTGQLHSGMDRTPPFEIAFRGNDKMQILAKSLNGGSVAETVVYKDSQDIVRGKWYTMKLDVQLGASGNGHVQAWRDGVEIADYTGKIGYTDQQTMHWNMGVYRKSPVGNETFAINYKDIDLTYGAAGHSTTPGAAPEDSSSPAPTPAPSPAPSPAPDVIGKTITGTSSNNTLVGTNGDDKIFGKSGNDVLTGGEGKDTFVFDTTLNSRSNVDTLKDFNVQDDTIYLENAVFKKVWLGNLGTDVFRIGTKALDHNDHIVYDKATGVISYDADGNGSGAAVQFAKVAAGTALTAADFFTI